DPDRVRLAWPGDPQGRRRPDPDPPRMDPDDALSEPVSEPRAPGAPVGAIAPADDVAMGTTGLRRAIVDAYDRLADRVLQRMRTLHDDVDADLAELRSEVTTLRQAVDDLGDRVQMRSLRA